MIPTIEGKKCCLRSFAWSDFSDFAGMWAEPAVAKYIPFAPLSPPQCWTRFNANIYRWTSHGVGQWCVADETGRLCGVVGFFENKIPKGAVGHGPKLMAGWVLSARVHRRGIGAEAVGLMHSWLDANSPPVAVVCGMHKSNVGSVRLAEMHGYRFLSDTIDEDGPGQLMLRKGT